VRIHAQLAQFVFLHAQAQQVGQLVGAGIELRVAPGLVAVDDRRPLGPARDKCPQSCRQACRAWSPSPSSRIFSLRTAVTSAGENPSSSSTDSVCSPSAGGGSGSDSRSPLSRSARCNAVTDP